MAATACRRRLWLGCIADTNGAAAVYTAALPIQSTPEAFLVAAAALAVPPGPLPWAAATEEAATGGRRRTGMSSWV